MDVHLGVLETCSAILIIKRARTIAARVATIAFAQVARHGVSHMIPSYAFAKSIIIRPRKRKGDVATKVVSSTRIMLKYETKDDCEGLAGTQQCSHGKRATYHVLNQRRIDCRMSHGCVRKLFFC